MKTHVVTTGIVIVALLAPVGPAAGRPPAAASGQGAQGSAAPASLRDLIAELRSPDPVKRAAAAYALMKLGSAAAPAIPELIRLLGDATVVDAASYRDPSAGRATDGRGPHETTPGAEAADALRAIGPAALNPLLAALEGGTPVARENAALALGELGDARAVEPLIAALRDSATPARRRAAWALGELGDKRAVEPLAGALKDQDTGTRQVAAWALGEIGDRGAASALSAALADADAGVREKAAWALGEAHAKTAVDALAAALGDADAGVRGRAAWALGEIGDRRAVKALSAALQDDDEEVRRRAAQALRDLTP